MTSTNLDLAKAQIWSISNSWPKDMPQRSIIVPFSCYDCSAGRHSEADMAARMSGTDHLYRSDKLRGPSGVEEAYTRACALLSLDHTQIVTAKRLAISAAPSTPRLEVPTVTINQSVYLQHTRSQDAAFAACLLASAPASASTP